jgi:hypothetical protein
MLTDSNAATHPMARHLDKPRPHNDVYTGLLAASLLGMVVACAMLLLDYQSYAGVKPPQPPVAAR